MESFNPSLISSIGLLTEAQYNSYNTNLDDPTDKTANSIYPIASGGDWWLNTGGTYSRYLAVVHNFKSNTFNGVANANLKVRPVISLTGSILNPDPAHTVKVGDIVSCANTTWIVLSSNYLICADCIGNSPFNKDWKSPTAMQYANSTISKYLTDWLNYWKWIPSANTNQ